MHPSPDASIVGTFLTRAAARRQVLAAVRGGAIGLAVASPSLLMVPRSPWLAATVALVSVLVGGALGWFARRGVRRQVAAIVERSAPACRNLVVTAAEMLDRPDWAAPHVRARVFRDAAALVPGLDVRTALPARPASITAATALVLWSGVAALAITRGAAPSGIAAPSAPTAATVTRVQVIVTPPDYTGHRVETLNDPARVVALAGSRLQVNVQADAASVTLETVGGSQALTATAAHAFTAMVVADADGYLAIAPSAANGLAGVRRLIGLTVTPDLPPSVRITAPGHDLLIDTGKRSVSLVAEANDDLGLATLALRYTKVGGSGETFTFTDGDVPLEVTRTPDGRWTGRAAWKLDALALEPGDMVIYRATASDKRPGAPPAESDTFIVEVTAPGALLSEGFAIDDRQDKYAISQQMVIVKTERVLARKASMSAEDFKDEVLGIAAEQRQVRAEFVFMMGGELADAGLDAGMLNEEAEAAGEEDLAAGRMANQGRIDLIRAIRAMSHAATRLGDTDPVAALPIEKQALAFLQLAFSRSRYILRTLGERERLDLSRRLTGTLAALSRPSRPASDAVLSSRVLALRRALADVSALTSRTGDAASAADAAALAQRVLQIDPASEPIREVATALTTASGLIAGGRNASAAAAEIDRAAVALASVVRAALPESGRRDSDAALSQLEGALADQRRRTGGRP